DPAPRVVRDERLGMQRPAFVEGEPFEPRIHQDADVPSLEQHARVTHESEFHLRDPLRIATGRRAGLFEDRRFAALTNISDVARNGPVRILAGGRRALTGSGAAGRELVPERSAKSPSGAALR